MGLGIREARQELSALVKRAAYGGEEVRIGSRGREEATLIGTAELERLRGELGKAKRKLQRASGGTSETSERPFAGVQAALESGELRIAMGSRRRRVVHNLRTVSGLTREEQARLGSRGTREPRFRRSEPRA